MSFSHRPTSAPQLRRRSEGDAEQARLYTQNSRLRASVEARAAGELVPHAELRSIHLAPQPEDEGASTAASSSADGPSNGGLLARTLSSLRRNLVPDDERVIALREQLATAASERDHARREWWNTLVKTWAVFIPVNVVSFTLMPPRHQATLNAAAGFVYAVVLSVAASRADRRRSAERERG